MSLINQMLQDLEKRQPANGDVQGLPEGVIPATEKKKALPKWALPTLLAVLVAGAAGIYAWRTSEQEKQAAATVAALLPPPALAPVEEPVAAPVPAVETVPPVVAAPTAVQPEAVGEKKMSRAEMLKASAEKKRAERLARAEAQKQAGAASQAKAPAAGKVAAGRIEKTVTQDDNQVQAEAIYRQAATAFSLGRSTESIDKLKQALALHAGHGGARQLLVKQLLEQHNTDEARGVLREGMRQASGQLQWATYLTRLELDRNDSQAARQVVDSVLPLAANNADFQSLAGAVAQRQGKAAESAEFYRQALALRANDARSWIGLGVALDAEGHKPEAREAYRRALAVDGLSPELEAIAQRKLR
jgi:MSHA biogenesis protein MshN